MKREDLEAAYQKIGGRDKFFKWARQNTRQFFSMFARDLLSPEDVAPQAPPPDPAILVDLAKQTLSGILAARARRDGVNEAIRKTPDEIAKAAPANAGLLAPLSPIPNTIDSRVGHGIGDTAAASVAASPQQNPALAQDKPQGPDPMPRRDKSAPSSICGIHGHLANNVGYPQTTDAEGRPTYGANWSQTRAY